MPRSSSTHLLLGALTVAIMAGGLVACTHVDESASVELADRVARGGRLYDKWYAEAGTAEPSTAHTSYPADSAYASKGSATWRCKECHGWDYLGKDGAYASGKHFTGVPGIRAYAGVDPATIAAVLDDDAHGFGDVLAASDVRDLALFVSRGQIDMDSVIDRATGDAKGDAARGAVYFATLCAGCHGPDGRAEDMPVLGPLARKNPWETLHKIVNGQPASAMPALRALDEQVAIDVLAHVRTLPGE